VDEGTEVALAAVAINRSCCTVPWCTEIPRMEVPDVVVEVIVEATAVSRASRARANRSTATCLLQLIWILHEVAVAVDVETGDVEARTGAEVETAKRKLNDDVC